MEKALKIAHGKQWYEFLTRTESGYDVTVTDEIVIREIWVENVYQVTADDLDDTRVVVDIGGNIGAFAIYAAALGARRVYTYEPDSLNWGVLTRNIKTNNLRRVVIPRNLAVAGEAGSAELVQGQGASFLSGIKNLTPGAALVAAAAERETVETVSLESVFADNSIPYCDILKIDCEGSEYSIIAGAAPEIIGKAKYITMEFHQADEETFGRLVARLSLTHNIHIIGRHDCGGQIYARRY